MALERLQVFAVFFNFPLSILCQILESFIWIWGSAMVNFEAQGEESAADGRWSFWGRTKVHGEN